MMKTASTIVAKPTIVRNVTGRTTDGREVRGTFERRWAIVQPFHVLGRSRLWLICHACAALALAAAGLFAEGGETSWRSLWMFSIPAVTEHDRVDAYRRGEHDLVVMPDGKSYFRESKLFDSVTNEVLHDIAEKGRLVTKRELFDQVVVRTEAPETLPLSKSFYFPHHGLVQEVVVVEDGAVRAAGTLLDLIGAPRSLGDEPCTLCFVSRDQTRIVMVQSASDDGSGATTVVHVAFDPESRTVLKRAETLVRFDVGRVAFVAGDPRVVISASRGEGLDPAGYVASRTPWRDGTMAVWNTSEPTVRKIVVNLAIPGALVKNKQYRVDHTTFDISPDGRTLAIAGTEIENLDHREAKIPPGTPIEKQREMTRRFYGLLLLYDTVTGKQSEQHLEIGVGRVKFIDDQKIVVSCYGDPWKRIVEKGWSRPWQPTIWAVASPFQWGNVYDGGGSIQSAGLANGVAIHDIASKSTAMVRDSSYLDDTGDLLALGHGAGRLVVVRDRRHGYQAGIQVEAFADDGQPAVENVSPLTVENKASFYPLYHNTSYFYEAATPRGGKLYMEKAWRRVDDEDGGFWLLTERTTTDEQEQEKKLLVHGAPFPCSWGLKSLAAGRNAVKTGGDEAAWRIERDQAMITKSFIYYMGTGGYKQRSADLKEMIGRFGIIPLDPLVMDTWKNDFRNPYGSVFFDYLAQGLRGTEQNDRVAQENQICEAKADPGNSKRVVVSRRVTATPLADRKRDQTGSYEGVVQETYERGIGLVSLVDMDGIAWDLTAIRAGVKEAPGHPLEYTILSGLEEGFDHVGGKKTGWEVVLALHAFKDGRFRGTMYLGLVNQRPLEFEGTYDGDRISFAVELEPGLPMKRFDGRHHGDTIEGTMGLIDVHKEVKVINQPFKAYRQSQVGW